MSARALLQDLPDRLLSPALPRTRSGFPFLAASSFASGGLLHGPLCFFLYSRHASLPFSGFSSFGRISLNQLQYDDDQEDYHQYGDHRGQGSAAHASHLLTIGLGDIGYLFVSDCASDYVMLYIIHSLFSYNFWC